jgi:hypothetical protein
VFSVTLRQNKNGEIAKRTQFPKVPLGSEEFRAEPAAPKSDVGGLSQIKANKA